MKYYYSANISQKLVLHSTLPLLLSVKCRYQPQVALDSYKTVMALNCFKSPINHLVVVYITTSSGSKSHNLTIEQVKKFFFFIFMCLSECRLDLFVYQFLALLILVISSSQGILVCLILCLHIFCVGLCSFSCLIFPQKFNFLKECFFLFPSFSLSPAPPLPDFLMSLNAGNLLDLICFLTCNTCCS